MEKFFEVKKHTYPKVQKGSANSYEDLVDQLIKNQFENKITIGEIHNTIKSYIEEENLFFLRNYNTASKDNYHSLRRGFKIYFEKENLNIAFCDDTFVMLFNAMKLFDLSYSMENLKNLFNQNKLICAFITTNEERELSFYKNKGAIITNSKFNANGWQLSHLHTVNFCNFSEIIVNSDRNDWSNDHNTRIDLNTEFDDESIKKIKAHFVRLIHPLNSFLIPKNKLIKYFGKRLGEEQELLQHVENYISKEFPKIYDEFKDMAMIKEVNNPNIISNNIQINWKNKK